MIKRNHTLGCSALKGLLTQALPYVFVSSLPLNLFTPLRCILTFGYFFSVFVQMLLNMYRIETHMQLLPSFAGLDVEEGKVCRIGET